MLQKEDMAKKLKIELDKAPNLMEKVFALIDTELDSLQKKQGNESLSAEDIRTLTSLSGILLTTYKDYRAEMLTIEKELKFKTKEELQQLFKADGK
jgi:hypothetical protein